VRCPAASCSGADGGPELQRSGDALREAETTGLKIFSAAAGRFVLPADK
jgi:hypothetical protein